MGNSKEICQVLINQGADNNKRDIYGFNAAHYSKEKDFAEYEKSYKKILGQALKVTPDDILEYREFFFRAHTIKNMKKKKKGRKKKKSR